LLYDVLMYFSPLDKTELSKIIDEKSQRVIKYYISKSLFAEPEPQFDKSEVSFRVPNEHIEQWIAQSIGGKRIGSGSYPIDLISSDGKFGADVAVVTAKTSKGKLSIGLSGEKSIGQKFADSEWGDKHSLDELFKSLSISKIAENSNEIFYNKFSIIKKDYPSIEKIYYFFVIIHSQEDRFYLFGLNVDYRSKRGIGSPTRKGKKELKNIILDNFIEEKYGEVTIYKSKKRMELRLRTKFLVENDYCMIFNIAKDRELVSIRDLSDIELKDLYIKEAVEQFNKVNKL
jgi:hypothetical protein